MHTVRSSASLPHGLGAPRLRLAAAAAGVGGLSLLLAQVLLGAAGDAMTGAAAALAGLVALLAWVAFGSLRRVVVFGVFLTAALDMNKAIVPPLAQFYSPGLYITLSQALLLLWAALWLGERLLLQRRRLPFTRLDGWALGFLGLVWWGALRSPACGLAWASAVAYSLCVLGFYVVSHALQSLADLRLALKALLVTFVLQASFVALQMVTRAPLVLPGIKVAGGDMTLALGESAAFRPIGLFNHPNVMADYAIWLILPALALVLMGRRRIAAGAWWAAVGVAVAGTGMLLASLSRGGWAACLLGTTVLGATYWRVRLIGRGHLLWVAVGLAVAAVAVVVVYPQVLLRLTEPDGRSTESRWLLADQALMIIRDQPWLGVGFGGYNRAAFDHIPSSWADVSTDYHKALLMLVVHNQYLLTAAELGLPVLLCWVLLLARFARQAWPLAQWPQPALFALGTGLGAAVVAHMLYLASDNYYVDIRVFMLWLAAGLLQALTLQAQRLRSRPAPVAAGAA